MEARLYIETFKKKQPHPITITVISSHDSTLDRMILPPRFNASDIDNYMALNTMLDRAKKIGITDLHCYTDSQTMPLYINGERIPDDSAIKNIVKQIKDSIEAFNYIHFDYESAKDKSEKQRASEIGLRQEIDSLD